MTRCGHQCPVRAPAAAATLAIARLTAIAGLALSVAACAVSERPETGSDGQSTAAALQQSIALLAGDYAGHPLSVDSDAGQRAAMVRVQIRPVSPPPGADAAVRIFQQSPGEPDRAFLMSLAPGPVPYRMNGAFSPIDDQGRARGTCPLEVTLADDGLVARTDADTCTFGEGAEAASLVKEIAHDGQRLVIGDRIVDPRTGQARGEDRVLELERVLAFGGWMGVRDLPDSSWRLADSMKIASDGRQAAPVDAAGMPLGVALELAPYRVRSDAPPVLRLRAFAVESGELLGQSWADIDATRIGLAIPSLQVGLERRLD